jgi:hypothetical protein
VNKFSRKIRSLSRRVGAKRVDDLDGTIAVLQIAKRLVKDESLGVAEALLVAADEFASPKDPVMAFWAAHFAYTQAKLRMDATDDELAVLEAAISAQGKVNQAVRKGPK